THTTHIYTLSLHDALPISRVVLVTLQRSIFMTAWNRTLGWLAQTASQPFMMGRRRRDTVGRKRRVRPALESLEDRVLLTVTAKRSEEHMSELQSRSDLVCR